MTMKRPWKNGFSLVFVVLACLLSGGIVLVPVTADGSEEQSPEFTLLPRSAWEGTPADTAKMVPQTEIREIVIHHSDGRAPAPDMETKVLRGIQSYHMDEKKWGDLAYHFLIAPSGRIYEGRNPAYAGDSATKYDLQGKLLICLLGGYEKTPPTTEALRALTHFVRAKMAEHGVPPAAVKGHRDYASTDCPGRYPYAWLQQFRRLAELAR